MFSKEIHHTFRVPLWMLLLVGKVCVDFVIKNFRTEKKTEGVVVEVNGTPWGSAVSPPFLPTLSTSSLPRFPAFRDNGPVASCGHPFG